MEGNSPKRRKLVNGGSITASIDSGVHRHNTFLLETEELVKEVGLNYKHTFADAGAVLQRLKQAVEGIEPHEPIPIGKAVSKFEKEHRIAVPFPHPKPPRDSNYKLSVAKPAKVNVVGSYVLKTMVKTQGKDGAVDMVVVMPEPLFQDKDYMNLRYFYKRSYFLAHLAVAVRQEMAGQMSVKFENLGENPLLPVLVVTPKCDKGAKKDAKKDEDGESEETILKTGTIRIIPCAPDELFLKKKLVSSSNCVRPAEDVKNPEDLLATPFYNSTLLAEMAYTSYLRLLHHTAEQCPAFRDACVLGRIWLQQRGIGGKASQGGFGHFELAVLTALLLRPGSRRRGETALSSSLSSTQIVKAVLRFLATTDFGNKPFIFSPDESSPAPKQGPALFDTERGHNFAFKMSPWSTALLRQHARWTTSLFADERADQFTPMFITKAGVQHLMYDIVLTIKAESIEAPESLDKKGKAWNVADKVYATLNNALGDRAQLIHIFGTPTSRWNLTASTPTTGVSGMVVGIVFDPVNMSRKMDKGPDAEDKAGAAKFRNFWGEKSELRRFQDGSMTENVIWKQTTPSGLCEEIVRYVLQRHCKLQKHDMVFSGSELPDLINASAADMPAFIATRTAFTKFEKDLRGLEKIPLHIRLVSAVAPELRYASLRLPPSTYNKKPSLPLDVFVSFEASSKWPENLVAIQRTKIAFLLKIGSLLEESKTSVKANIGLENNPIEIENPAFLDVTYDSAVTFRLRIHCDIEETLLRQRAKDKLLEQHVRAESAELLAGITRRCVNLPYHTQAVSRLTTLFPALSPTIRLLKHWFQCHKLSPHFSDELVEIFAVNTFLQPYPWQPPSSANTGFLRTLQWLARWDWRDEPLVVDFTAIGAGGKMGGGDMTITEVVAVETRLKAWRKIDPNMNRTVLCVATNGDASGTGWTGASGPGGGRGGPSKVVAARMTGLARGAVRVMKAGTVGGRAGGEGGGWAGVDLGLLFTPSFGEFDFILHLDAEVLEALISAASSGSSSDLALLDSEGPSSNKQAKKDKLRKFKNLSTLGQTPLVTDPIAAFVGELERVYGDVMLLFYEPGASTTGEDGYEGSGSEGVVLGVWNAQFRARSFRVNLPCSFMPTGGGEEGGDEEDGDEEESDDDGDVMEVNRVGILGEIARIGGDLVERVEVLGGL